MRTLCGLHLKQGMPTSALFQNRNDGLPRLPIRVSGEMCKLMIRTTSRYAIYFHETDETDKGKKKEL